MQACDSHRMGLAMNAPSYLDFDFDVVRQGTRYRGRVLSSPAGQASHEFAIPFNRLELENFYLRVGRARRGTRRIGSPEMNAARDYGRRLFEATFGGDVNACLRAALNEAQRQDKGLRIRLRLTEAPELGDLAWEYLCNPALERFLSLSVDTPVVRYLDLPEAIRPLKVTKPLRVLVVVSSPSDHPALDVEREWSKLKQALSDLEGRGWVQLDKLSDGRLATLQKRLRSEAWHVFHFIGHGGFDSQAQDGTLIFEDSAGKGHAVSGEYLGALLHDERTLRIAMLNACEGARTSLTDPFSGVAQSLVRQGVPAVIAMQFEITDDAAITIAHEFYGAIADGYPVDGALAEARKALFAQGNDIEWGTPVLYMRSPDGHIFEIDHVEPCVGSLPDAGLDPRPVPRPEPLPPPQARQQPTTSPPLATPGVYSRLRLPRLLWPGVLVTVIAAAVLLLWLDGRPTPNPIPPQMTPPVVAAVPIDTLSDRAAQGDEDAWRSLRTLATQGEPAAQLAIGRLYAEGRGVTEDRAAASDWLSKAAAAGSGDARAWLTRYDALWSSPPARSQALRGLASRGDREALIALQRLAQSGDADAQYELGRMMTLGDGMPKNSTEGRSWIQKAAAQGHAEAVKATAKPEPQPKPNENCSDLLAKQSLGVALSAEERKTLNKDCR